MNEHTAKAARLGQIRRAERESHIKAYTKSPPYEGTGWLSRPVRTVLEMLPLFEGAESLRVLDLGAGVGRNCLPFAVKYRDIPCRIDCVDILELASRLLEENAKKYGVGSQIRAVTSPIEDFLIRTNEYDLIMAVSALEHVESRKVFWAKVREIREGIREGGAVCLVVNSNVTEADKATGEALPPQFEVNLRTDELRAGLDALFSGWRVLKYAVSRQKYHIPSSDRVSALTSDVVTFAAAREREN